MRFLTRLFLLGGTICLWLPSSHQLVAAQSLSPQTTVPSAAKPQGQAEAATTVDPARPVITIRGLCGDSSKTGGGAASCNKVITREEFEMLMEALNPSGQRIPDTGRQNLARTYAEAFALEAAARKAGLEETPRFREAMEFVRLRTLGELYRLALQEKFRTPPPEEIDAYYKQHLADFERVKLARILIPREDPSAADKAAFDKRAAEAANTAHERTAKGDDPAKIQQDVYSALGLKSPPPTDIGTFGRSNFTDKEGLEVFALKPGEVSSVEVEPKSYVIYRVDNKTTLSEDQVRADIARGISQQKLKDAIKAATDAAPAEFNEQYFGPGIKAGPGVAPPLPRPAN